MLPYPMKKDYRFASECNIAEYIVEPNKIEREKIAYKKCWQSILDALMIGADMMVRIPYDTKYI